MHPAAAASGLTRPPRRLGAHPWLTALVALVVAAPPLVFAGERPAPAAQEAAGLVSGLPDFRNAVRSVTPAVVNISTSRSVPGTTRSLGPMMPLLPFGPEFFGHLMPTPQPRERLQQRSLGSGVIVDPSGLVLTNNHVVQDADEVTVTLADGREFEAEVVGLDAPTDVAVLRIDADDLVSAELADSTAVEVGDWVLAVGNPFGLGHTVTHGIVSALGRSGVGVTQYEDFIQTDAAINPGNSGGPLVDLHGRVVGINTAIASRSGGNMGIGFAIPAHQAQQVMQGLVENGRVERGWLGVYIQDLSPDLAESFDYDGGHGVLVSQVVEGSPAEQAGLQAGDIVVRLDGRDMTSSNGLATAVATLASGTEVALEVFRDGRRLDLTAVISRSGREDAATDSATLAQLGLSARGVTRELVERHDLAVTEGVLVTAVEPGGLADRLGIRPGHVILSVGDARVNTSDELAEALEDAREAGAIRLLIDIDGRRRFLLVRP